ncbi:MAG: ABC transporter permease subunit [Verrucomicrobia bacterium]|nr:ABC transporter permease subunit [Verrucomicrobiota bacterium]
MTSVIGFGGVCIVVAVFGIFAFILSEVFPLFGKARLHETARVGFPGTSGGIIGLDEWSQLPFHYDGQRTLRFQPVNPAVNRAQQVTLTLPDAATVTSHRFDAEHDRLILGLSDGQVAVFQLKYTSSSAAKGTPVVTGTSFRERLLPLTPGLPVETADYKDAGDRKLVAAIQGKGGDAKLLVTALRQTRSLMGAGQVKMGERIDLTAKLEGQHPERLLIPGSADSLIVGTDRGEVFYLFSKGIGWEVRQHFKPFEGEGRQLGGIDLLLGDVSLVAWNAEGAVRIFSLFVPEGQTTRVFGQTKAFPPLAGGVLHYLPSQRNKSFALANDQVLRVCHATTEGVRASVKLAFRPVDLASDEKNEHLALLDPAGFLHLFEVDDPHPEAGFRAFFSRIWYEGSSKPKYEWQSTSGTDDFEPKLSLTPLIIGSLKGTLYALFFAVPIALLAAIFVAQFMHPEVKKVVKPIMEIMASLPSVVLGFLAALWLAPLIESRVPSVLAISLLIPLLSALLGFAWSRLPIRYRNLLPKGSEYLVLLPVVILTGWVGWQLGPVLERALFVTTTPEGGRIADFRLWWPQVTGTPYDQRNCLVVGFMMGFAVIPIIFTISEDSLSNVPPSIISASEALGASRWQVVRTVVLPVASAGIFSALMIGFGRAVGETMIVVMATGNTAIMDANGHLLLGEPGLGHGRFPLADHWNIFNGMRTLSANIAVELPEAAVHSTHYRTLFLGAMVLFLMTFSLNTAAELLRQRLREKFRVG